MFVIHHLAFYGCLFKCRPFIAYNCRWFQKQIIGPSKKSSGYFMVMAHFGHVVTCAHYMCVVYLPKRFKLRRYITLQLIFGRYQALFKQAK